MSANEHEGIDPLCPHGDDEHDTIELCFIGDSELYADPKCRIYDPDPDAEGAWIEADREVFIEVGER